MCEPWGWYLEPCAGCFCAYVSPARLSPLRFDESHRRSRDGRRGCGVGGCGRGPPPPLSGPRIYALSNVLAIPAGTETQRILCAYIFPGPQGGCPSPNTNTHTHTHIPRAQGPSSLHQRISTLSNYLSKSNSLSRERSLGRFRVGAAVVRVCDGVQIYQAMVCT